MCLCVCYLCVICVWTKAVCLVSTMVGKQDGTLWVFPPVPIVDGRGVTSAHADYTPLLWTCRCPATNCGPKKSFRRCHQGINVRPLLSTDATPILKRWLELISMEIGRSTVYRGARRVWHKRERGMLGAPGLCTNPEPWPGEPVQTVYSFIVRAFSVPNHWTTGLVRFSGEVVPLLHFHLVQKAFTQDYVKRSRQCKHTSWCWKLCSSWGNHTMLPQQLLSALLNLFLFGLAFLQIKK